MSTNKGTNPRVSLNKAQLQEGAGAELFSLCQGMTADGKVSKEEIIALKEWLEANQNASLPGIEFLTETLKRIIADGRVTRDESRELLEAIEKVLPPDARKVAKAARREVEKKRKAAEKEAAKAEKIQQRRQQLEEYLKRAPEEEFDFMVAGVHAEGRYNIIARFLNVGDRVRLRSEPENNHDDCAVAIELTDGQLIGYVPRDDSENVTYCIEEGGYYVAKVKKILTGGRLPIPVIVVEFFRPEQIADIADLKPNTCKSAAFRDSVTYTQSNSSSPWWKFW